MSRLQFSKKECFGLRETKYVAKQKRTELSLIEQSVRF